MKNSIPRFGFGTYHLAVHGFKGYSVENSRKVLRAAIDEGTEFFDTAPIYGFGLAEQILGEELSSLRDGLWIATKCGLIAENGRVRHDLSYDSILRECESSLKRLKTTYIDLYQIHWPDPETPLHESCRALQRLLDEKLVRHVGVSNFPVEMLTQIITMLPVFSVQNHFSALTDTDLRQCIPWCVDNSVHYIAYNILEQGLLTEGMDKNFTPGKHDIRRLNPLFRNSMDFAKAIQKRNEIGIDSAETAIRYVLGTQGISTLLFSTANTGHLHRNIVLINQNTNSQTGHSVAF